MATQLPYITQGHRKHDVHWMVISPGHSGVLCVACLVEQVENDEAPLVQRKVVLSLLASLLGDSKEVAAKFEENLLLCRHMIDIVTVCQLILETAESEDLVWYAIDKFHFQLQDSQDLVSVSPYLLLLGRLLVISPAYGFHLLHKHESLLLLVLRLLSQTSDESCLCSVIYIFIHLLDDSLQSDVSLDVRCCVNQVLVSLLTCAESLDLRVNLLALLKNILKHTDENTVKLLMAPNPDNKYLVMGLKKMLITKQEVLQTASAHCVTVLMSCSKDESTVTQILESDLAEFLFESLHSQSGPQLE
ncbi:meiosis inhibitor protein 1-like [Haliotis cracherodii]|uniref:meiosis inhibitor protein 1-like n=1 Tax=Haliotis cracherodii TaxID=6455 RepID=UPI0039EB956C